MSRAWADTPPGETESSVHEVHEHEAKVLGDVTLKDWNFDGMESLDGGEFRLRPMRRGKSDLQGVETSALMGQPSEAKP